MEFENTIGLETHVQLETKTKMFCSCLLKTGCEPNTNVCPVLRRQLQNIFVFVFSWTCVSSPMVFSNSMEGYYIIFRS